MLTILIVDDDKREREGIESLIYENNYKLKVYKVKNGEEAFKMLSNKDYDILLTDIKMPFMDGIELIQNAHAINPSMISIIYSAYGDFEYAQQAVNLGVMRYLLKPIQRTEFVKLFREVIDICKSKQQLKLADAKRESELKKKILTSDIVNLIDRNGNTEYLLKKIIKMDTRLEKKITPILLSSYQADFYNYWDTIKFDLKNFFPEEPLLILIESNQILLLIFENNKSDIDKFAEWLKSISDKFFTINLSIVVGEVIHSIVELKQELFLMQELMDYQFFSSNSFILYRGYQESVKNSTTLVEAHLANILAYVLVNDTEGIKSEIDMIIDSIKHDDITSISVKYIFTEIVKKIYESYQLDIELDSIVKSIYLATNLNEIKNRVINLLKNIENDFTDNRPRNSLVTDAIIMIKKEFSNIDLSLSLVAENLKISPAYLSTLFKIEMGVNFSKYVTNLRLEKSKTLLLQTSLKIAEISKRVGYLNDSYYISLFKAKEGISPTQFRESKNYV